METKKYTSEKIPISMDFVRILPAGESLVAIGSSVVIEDLDGIDVTSAMLFSTIQIIGTKLLAIIHQGITGQTYTVRFKGKTQNYLLTEEVALTVN